VDNTQVEKIRDELRQLENPEDESAPYFAEEKESFLDALVAESTQIQAQASAGVTHDAEKPLFEGGLIPSPDGFRWLEATPEVAAVE